MWFGWLIVNFFVSKVFFSRFTSTKKNLLGHLWIICLFILKVKKKRLTKNSFPWFTFCNYKPFYDNRKLNDQGIFILKWISINRINRSVITHSSNSIELLISLGIFNLQKTRFTNILLKNIFQHVFKLFLCTIYI